MNYGQLQAFLIGSVLRRTGDTDIEALAPTAINLAKLELQRLADWHCMNSHEVLTYRDGGLSLAADIKRVRAVYRVNGQATPPVRGARLLPVTETDRAAGLPDADRLLDPHWLVEEQSLVLLGQGTDGLKLWIDTVRRLPDYAADEDEDWFTTWAWDALAYKAAEIGFLSQFEDGLLASYAQLAATKIAQARKLDVGYSEGGTGEAYRPARTIISMGGFDRGSD